MPIFKTKTCRKFNHPEFVLFLNDASGLDPTWLIEFFQNAVSQGQQFTDGETVQIGWMLTLLKMNSEGDLELWEPHFDSIPIKWIHGINNTLRHLILQKSTSELFDSEPNFASLHQAGIITSNFLQSEFRFTMSRIKSSNNDSGWRFSESSEIVNQVEWRSLFEISFHQNLIVPFIALPESALVVKNFDEITVKLGDKTLSSQDNALLYGLLHSPILF